MSRLSKAVRKISYGPIVTVLVRLVETWLGGGTGAIKKQLVTEITKSITKAFAAAGVKTPENPEALVDELIETNVALLYHNGNTEVDGKIVPKDAATATVVSATPVRKRAPRGSRAVAAKPTPEIEDADLTAVELADDEEE